MSADDEDKSDKPVVLSQATLGDIYTQLARIDERTALTAERVAQLPCHYHLGEISALRAKVERIEKDEERRANDRAEEREIVDHSHQLDTPPSKSPSALYQAVGAKIERAAEDATGKFDLLALQATQKAADDLAKKQHEAALRALELQHERAKSWLKIAVVALGLLGGGGGIAAVKAWINADAREAKTEQVLKRIEQRQGKLPRPDAAVEP